MSRYRHIPPVPQDPWETAREPGDIARESGDIAREPWGHNQRGLGTQGGVDLRIRKGNHLRLQSPTPFRLGFTPGD